MPARSFEWQTSETALAPVLDGNWLIKKLLPAQGLAVAYGRPGCGKSFLITDIALYVASGMTWRGMRTRQAGVSYIASEAGSMGPNRIHAWCNVKCTPWPKDFRISPSTLDLRSSEVDAETLIADIRTNQPTCGLVVVDTLSRNFGGGVENATEDMAAFVGHCDAIAKALNCLVLIVHHSGKQEALGARGSTALLGAVSTELEIKREQGLPGSMRVTKQRDGEDGKEFGFILSVVELGKDRDGDDVTSCMILEAGIDPKLKAAGGKHQRAVQKMFVDYLVDAGEPCPVGIGFPDPGKYRAVDLEAFLDFAAGRMTGTQSRKDARRAVNGLVDRNILAINGGKLWYIVK